MRGSSYSGADARTHAGAGIDSHANPLTNAYSHPATTADGYADSGPHRHTDTQANAGSYAYSAAPAHCVANVTAAAD